jgi:hypothetical protein
MQKHAKNLFGSFILYTEAVKVGPGLNIRAIIENYSLLSSKPSKIFGTFSVQTIRLLDPIASYLNPGCGPTNGSLVLESNRILLNPVEIRYDPTGNSSKSDCWNSCRFRCRIHSPGFLLHLWGIFSYITLTLPLSTLGSSRSFWLYDDVFL